MPTPVDVKPVRDTVFTIFMLFDQVFDDVWTSRRDVCGELSTVLIRVVLLMAASAQADDVCADVVSALRAEQHVMQMEMPHAAAQFALILLELEQPKEIWVTTPHRFQ